MKCKEEYMRLYAVTDRMWTGKQTLLEQVEAALKGGATLFLTTLTLVLEPITSPPTLRFSTFLTSRRTDA